MKGGEITRVYIAWDDAQTQDGWDSYEGVVKNIGEPYRCETIGWLLDKDDKRVIVCHTRNNVAVCGAISIPVDMIKDYKILK